MPHAVPEEPERDVAEDLWLSCHDLWLQPLQWWTAWWNAWGLPIVPHPPSHAHANGGFHWLTVPEPIARDPEQDLFA